jgi:hypothetical protein
MVKNEANYYWYGLKSVLLPCYRIVHVDGYLQKHQSLTLIALNMPIICFF